MSSNSKSIGFIMTFFLIKSQWFRIVTIIYFYTVPYCMKIFAFFATSMFCTLHRRNNSLHPCHRAFRVSSITKWVQSLYKIALNFWRIKLSEPFSDWNSWWIPITPRLLSGINISYRQPKMAAQFWNQISK